MKVTMPDEIPFIELAKFATSQGCELVTADPDHIVIRKRTNVTELRSRRNSAAYTINNHPTFDGPGVA